MRAIRYTALFLLLLAGCAQLGITQPQGFDQQLAYAYGNVTAARKSATAALGAKQISAADAKQVLELTDHARALLDGARAASKAGSHTTAADKLALANGILQQLQTYLTNRGIK